MRPSFNSYGFTESHCVRANENKVKCVVMTSVSTKWSRHESKERLHASKRVCMRGYIWRKELHKWWEHVLSCYVKTCNTRSKAARLWKKATWSNLAGIISKLKMYEHSLLYHAVFSWRKGSKSRSAMRKSRSVILCFLFVYFLFCKCYYASFISRY